MTRPEKLLAMRFCKIVCHLGYDDLTYDFPPDKVTLNDIPRMRRKIRYIRDTYYEDGHANAALKEENCTEWRNHLRMLERFLKAAKAECDMIDGIMNASGWDKMSLQEHLYWRSFMDKDAAESDVKFFQRCYSLLFGKKKPKAEQAARFLKDCERFLEEKKSVKSFPARQQATDVRAVIKYLELGTKGDVKE